ncbi:MAG: C4-type zinc ribbon domain-containing protein, partial [Acidimicrobiia bacterium]|nr:C4-type zinc ribbon domain-containing protein [Acidimicrobiia bacterium]
TEATMKTHEVEVAEAWKRIDGEIARKESRKEAIVPLIDTDILELYESLRSHKEGVGAARLADGVCGGCHLTLSPAEQLEVLSDEPPRCLHCRRILVV